MDFLEFMLLRFCFLRLSLTGIIPESVDTSPNSYYTGYPPSSGKVCGFTFGFGTGSQFTRLHVKSNLYKPYSSQILTSENMPKVMASAPWWWGANPNGKITILIGEGKGVDCESYEIYDPEKELLLTYAEWDRVGRCCVSRQHVEFIAARRSNHFYRLKKRAARESLP